MSGSSVEAHVEALRGQIQEVLAELEGLLVEPPEVAHSGEELEALEGGIVGQTDRLAGLLIGLRVQRTLAAEEVRAEAGELAKGCARKLRDHGLREVLLRPLRGEAVAIQVAYYRTGSRRLGSRGKGLYPGLVLLGIHDRCTPGLASEVSLLATALSSFEEAARLLQERGLPMDAKTVRSISYRYAERARRRLSSETTPWPVSGAGRRVVVSTDGGRVRERRDSEVLKTAKGRRRYFGQWREPKLLPIYTLDAEGRPEREFAPFIDGTLGGADALFMLLGHYLAKLGISAADTVVIIADGARWIWTRVAKVLTDLGLKPGQWREVVDFYHAVEHLGAAAALCKRWSAAERQRWVKIQRWRLKKGYIDRVIEALRELCQGRRSQGLRREREYFVHNRPRMAYDQLAAQNLPRGSGAMESAIRRVVNLRLKGAGIFWHKAGAEAMLLLRAYYKAGRWNFLKKLVFSTPCLELA